MRTIVKKYLTGFRAEKLGGRNFHLSVKGMAEKREIIEFSYLVAQVSVQHPRWVLNEVSRDEFI